MKNYFDNPTLRWTGGSFFLCLLGLGSYFSVRFALADHNYRQNTVDTLRVATAMMPSNAEYHALLAEHLEGLGVDPTAELVIATRLNPLEARFWIRLAFQAEASSDYAGSERYLLRAASVNHQFLPRWALLNFYYRRGNRRGFWRWVDAALPISYEDPTTIFDLEWRLADDTFRIENHIPKRLDLQTAYLRYLLERGHGDVAAAAASFVANNQKAAGETSLVLAWCDVRMLADDAPVIKIWNTLCARGALPFTPLDPQTGRIITNGDLAFAPLLHGYDWRMPPSSGISMTSAGDSGHGIIQLSGDQPDDAVIMEQWIPLTESLDYQISWEFRCGDACNMPGFRWTVSEAETNGRVIASSEDMRVTGEWQRGELRMSAGRHHLARLSLGYRRPLGSSRARGSIQFRHIAGKIAR